MDGWGIATRIPFARWSDTIRIGYMVPGSMDKSVIWYSGIWSKLLYWSQLGPCIDITLRYMVLSLIWLVQIRQNCWFYNRYLLCVFSVSASLKRQLTTTNDTTIGIGYCDYHLVTNIGYCDYLPALICFSDVIILIALWQISDIVTVLAMSWGSHNIRYLHVL